MLVALLNTKATLRARYLMECFEAGIKRHGDQTLWVENYKTYRQLLQNVDVGVQVCAANRHHNSNEQSKFRIGVHDTMTELGKRILTVDTGFVRNQSDYELLEGAKERKHKVLFDMNNKATYERVLLDIYYEVGFDGLKRNADYCVRGASPERWNQLRREIKPWRRKGTHILILGQTYHGLSSQHVDIFAWYAKAVAKIRKVSQRPIVFRQHPRITKIREGNRSRAEKDKGQVLARIPHRKNFSWGTGWTVEEDLKGAHAAVVFSSNASVTAVLEGIPVFVGDPGCMAWPVANKDMSQIERPDMPDRKQWAYDLAWAQWNCAELLDGQAWAHLRPHALKPITRGPS